MLVWDDMNKFVYQKENLDMYIVVYAYHAYAFNFNDKSVKNDLYVHDVLCIHALSDGCKLPVLFKEERDAEIIMQLGKYRKQVQGRKHTIKTVREYVKPENIFWAKMQGEVPIDGILVDDVQALVIRDRRF